MRRFDMFLWTALHRCGHVAMICAHVRVCCLIRNRAKADSAELTRAGISGECLVRAAPEKPRRINASELTTTASRHDAWNWLSVSVLHSLCLWIICRSAGSREVSKRDGRLATGNVQCVCSATYQIFLGYRSRTPNPNLKP